MNISFNRGITAGVTVFLGKIVVYGYCRCCGFNLFLNNMLKAVRLLWIFLLCSPLLVISIYRLTVRRSQLNWRASFEQFTFISEFSFIKCFTLSKMSFRSFIFAPPERSILLKAVLRQNCTFWVGVFVHFHFNIYKHIFSSHIGLLISRGKSYFIP